MELGIETTIDGQIHQPGKIAIEAKLFSEIVRKLPDNDVTIETDDQYKATITCEKACFQIMGQESEEFPSLPEIEKNQSITLSQFSLKEVIRQTIFSISDNENTKLMTGELFEVKDDQLSGRLDLEHPMFICVGDLTKDRAIDIIYNSYHHSTN